MIVAPYIETALDLQDQFTDVGAAVVTAYRLERALELANHALLGGAVIESSVYENSTELRARLIDRGIPYVVHRATQPESTVICELSALTAERILGVAGAGAFSLQTKAMRNTGSTSEVAEVRPLAWSSGGSFDKQCRS